MSLCEWCNKEFDEFEAEEHFETETGLAYNNLNKCLCGECATKLLLDVQLDGIYFETCEECFATFDLIEEESRFDRMDGGIHLRDVWDNKGKILCATCAKEE